MAVVMGPQQGGWPLASVTESPTEDALLSEPDKYRLLAIDLRVLSRCL